MHTYVFELLDAIIFQRRSISTLLQKCAALKAGGTLTIYSLVHDDLIQCANDVVNHTQIIPKACLFL